jgi:hypothetical protein
LRLLSVEAVEDRFQPVPLHRQEHFPHGGIGCVPKDIFAGGKCLSVFGYGTGVIVHGIPMVMVMMAVRFVV